MTFAEACRRFLEQHNAKWESLKHRSQWENTLRNYAERPIGGLPVADIEVPLVLKVLEQPVKAKRGYPAGPLWSARPETANRLRGRIEAVLDWAKARGHRTGDNPGKCCPPAAALSTMLPCPTQTSLPSWRLYRNAQVSLPRRWRSQC